MANILSDGDCGLDYVFSDETDQPNVEEVVKLIQDKIKVVGSHGPLVVRARLNREDRARVLKAFPTYKRCYEERKGMIILDHVGDD
jgi:hypothetical protein